MDHRPYRVYPVFGLWSTGNEGREFVSMQYISFAVGNG